MLFHSFRKVSLSVLNNMSPESKVWLRTEESCSGVKTMAPAMNLANMCAVPQPLINCT